MDEPFLVGRGYSCSHCGSCLEVSGKGAALGTGGRVGVAIIQLIHRVNHSFTTCNQTTDLGGSVWDISLDKYTHIT